MSIVDQLLQDYKKEAEFTVTLPKGEALKFKNVTDFVEYKKLTTRARQFAKAHVAGRHGKDPDVKTFATTDEELALTAFLVSELSIDPKFTVGDILKLSRQAVALIGLISKEVTTQLSIEAAIDETQELDELGEDFAATSSGRTD